MSLAPVTSRDEVKSAWRQFARAMSAGARKQTAWVGWKGESGAFDVYWREREGIWSFFNPTWCGFGVGEPRGRSTLSITVQIDPPRSGYNRRNSGVFLRDAARHVYVAHSGKIGGGRKGIGKTSFRAMYRGDNIEQVEWPDGEVTELVVLGRLESQRLPAHVAHFVHEVARVKDAVTRTPRMVAKVVAEDTFNPEFHGPRAAYEPKGTVEATCDHGIVVNRLRSTIVDKTGIEPKNRKTRDLFITDSRGRVTTLFEVKTDLSTGSMYTGVGQLLLNGVAEGTMPKLVLVVPGKPSARTSKALRRLNVRVLSYDWKEGMSLVQLKLVAVPTPL